MRKVGIVFIVCLLAVAGITAAMAYTSATVENSMEFGIVSTDEAKLALSPNPEHVNVVAIKDGVMVLEFLKNGEGFQPDSWYYYEELFYITNNLDEDVWLYWGWIDNLGDFDPLNDSYGDLTGPDLMSFEMHSSVSGEKKVWDPGVQLRWCPAGHTAPTSILFRPLLGQDNVGDIYDGYLVIHAEPK